MLAFTSKHPYVPKPSEDPKASRWIASLSDGTTVFEDVIPGETSAWRRLSDYVKVHNLKITNLRLEAYGLQIVLLPYRGEDKTPQINGYWHSKGIGVLLCDEGIFEGQARGIGYLKGLEVIITWVSESGNIKQEIRPYVKGDPAIIINDHPV